MKILHLFSNWKWTGPAEPALNLAWAQSESHDVVFLSGQAPHSHIAPQVARRGVATRDGFHLRKHASLLHNRRDAARLSELLESFRPDVVHCHLDNDHRIAATAVKRTGIGRLVRTAYDATGLSASLRMRAVVGRALDGLIVTSPAAAERTRLAWGARLAVPLAIIEGAIDLQRFDPARFDRAAERVRLGLVPTDVAVGIVARVQGHRRFDVLIEAVARLAAEHPEFRLVVIGRGTRLPELLLAPVERAGLQRVVLTTGYLEGDAFVGGLAALDASLFLVPGSDGSCRALREQLAMGLPALVSRRPPLPEIVEHGVSGLVVDDSSEGLEQGLRALLEGRARLAAGALAAARRRFDLGAQARAVLAFYEEVRAQSVV